METSNLLSMDLQDLFDQQLSDYVGIPLRTYIEKIEDLAYDELDVIAELFTISIVTGTNTREQILKILNKESYVTQDFH